VARETGGAVAAVLRLGGKVEHPDAVLKAMKDGQRADGGYGKDDSPASDLESTYRVMRSLHMLKRSPRTWAGCGRSSMPAATTTAATASSRASRRALRDVLYLQYPPLAR